MPPTMTPLALATTFELAAGFLALVAMRSAYGRARSGYAAAGFALFAVLWADGLLRYWDGRLASLGYGAVSGLVTAARHACAGALVALALASFLVLASALLGRARPDGRLLALCAASAAFAAIALLSPAASLSSPATAVAHTVASLAVAAVALPRLLSSRRARPAPATTTGPATAAATTATTVTTPAPSAATAPAAVPEQSAAPAIAAAPGVSPSPSPLSARELEVARLLSSGLSYKEIGEKLFIAPSTVKTHAIRVYEKMGVDNKMRLAVALKDYE